MWKNQIDISNTFFVAWAESTAKIHGQPLGGKNNHIKCTESDLNHDTSYVINDFIAIDSHLEDDILLFIFLSSYFSAAFDKSVGNVYIIF